MATPVCSSATQNGSYTSGTQRKTTAKTWKKKKRMPLLHVPQIEMHCRMSTSQMTVKSHSNSPLLLSATPAVCNQVISSFNLGFDRNACTWVLPGTTAPCWIVSIHSTLTWACHSAFASPGCPVSCFLYGSWGSLVAHSVFFLLTDNYHQTLLTRPMKGAKAREEFAIASLSDKYRGTLLFSLLWGWFTTTLNRIPVSSTPLHFSRVVCLRQFIIHSSFP